MKIKKTNASGPAKKVKLALKSLISFVLVFFLSTFSSCGDKKQAQAIIAPQGMHTLDLTRYGKPFAIFVPDTVAAKLSVTEQSSGSLEIKVGKNFAVSISEVAADIELRKTDIKDDEVNKLKSFLVEEPTSLLWESAWEGTSSAPQFHFLINKTVGQAEYSFEDIKDPEATPFGKEAIQKMFDSCKNITGTENQAKS